MKGYPFGLIFILFFSLNVHAGIEDYFSHKITPSASNYGNTGLMELPNARQSKAATLRWNFSGSYPFEYTSVTATPFSWMEATYRYTEIKNVKYGPASYSGNQSLKDKGFDVKFRIIDESRIFPAVALGFRDIAGTGRFSSEYIISTKKIGDFDLSLGLGWGLLGKESNISNPFRQLSDNFKNRSENLGLGGKFSTGEWFSGDTAVLAGVEYDLNPYGLRFKIEYDTSQPDTLPNGTSGPLQVKNKLNFGLNYSFSENLDLATSFERGHQFRIGFSIKGNFLNDTLRKPKPKNIVRLNKDQIKRTLEDKSIFYRSLNRSLRDEGIFLQASSYSEDEVELSIASTRYYSFTRAAGRSARVADALSSESVDVIKVRSMNGDLEVASFEFNRNELQNANSSLGSPAELYEATKLSSESNNALIYDADFIPIVNFPEFNWNMSPSLKHQIGGPEGFYLGQLSWQTDFSVKLRRKFSFHTSIGLNIYDTFNNLNNPSQSSIPRVRSDIQKYLSQGKNNLKRFHFEYMDSPYKDVFLRGDIGFVEEMFAALGGEILYRPFKKRFALGLSAHKVKQRNYDQRFSLLPYENITGHLSYYQEMPSDILVKLSAGEYLAGDVGLSLDLSRRFKTGFTLGVFASKTNLSAEEFGEGSFDKGFYFSIPVNLFYSDFRSGNISFGLHPLTKDGAATLNVPRELYGVVGDTNESSITRDWDYITK